MNLYKKESNSLSSRIQTIEEELNQEKEEILAKSKAIEAEHSELVLKHDRLVKQYERVKKEKEENDLMGNEEIQKLKLNYEALLESERTAKDDVKK